MFCQEKQPGVVLDYWENVLELEFWKFDGIFAGTVSRGCDYLQRTITSFKLQLSPQSRIYYK